jgi:hypothetical protein
MAGSAAIDPNPYSVNFPVWRRYAPQFLLRDVASKKQADHGKCEQTR